MNPVKFVAGLIVGMAVLFLLRVLSLTTPLTAKVLATPWWMLFVVVGIIVSGILSFRYAKEDKEQELMWIEQEGEKIMEPIRKKRQKINMQ